MINSKKVLHLITGLERGGGAENMLLNLIPRLNGNHAVCVMKGKGEIAIELEKKNIKIYYLKVNNPFNISYIFRYRKIIKDLRPDIQINYLIHADIFGRIFGKLFKVPKVVSYIRNKHEEIKYFWIDRVTLLLCDFILVNSKPLIDFYTQKHKLKNEKIKFIPNAVDMDKIEELSKRNTDFNFKENRKYIISTARLHPQKDIPTIINAFFLLQKENQNCDLIIANDGPQRIKIESMVKNLGIHKNVHFIGKKSNVYPFVVKSNLFVLASKFEGMSNALLESMALGVIALASNIPENTQIIHRKKNGYTFKVGDKNDLFEKMKLALNHDNIEITSEAKLEIKNNYSIKKVVNELDNFILNYGK